MPYQAISEELHTQGFVRDFKQCRKKIKQLKKKYKETVDKLRQSGVSIELDDDLDDHEIFVHFKWFANIRNIIRRRTVVNPPTLRV